MNHDIQKEYAEFISRVEYGEYEEYELVRFMTFTLATEEQKSWLADNRLLFEDLLHGMWHGDREEEQVQKMFDDWNAKCGTNLFRIA